MSRDGANGSSQMTKSLACVACKQRKLRCDRESPCANCVKSGQRCIPGNVLQRQRKRRFPERELLVHVRRCEALLRENNISFEPLHSETTKGIGKSSNSDTINLEDGSRSNERSEASTTASNTRATAAYEAKSSWHMMNRGFRDSDNESDSSQDAVREGAVRREWDRFAPDGDSLLFGSYTQPIDLSTLHPDPVQSFRLWQTYLDNVNPLLKVTHTPILQGRFVEAISNVKNTPPPLEALIFGIYCMSILSLTEAQCIIMFGSHQKDLLTRFQLACQQALWNCNFLRSNQRDSLTALFLYLVSVRAKVAPQSLTCMLGVAIRIAQRMGMHSESMLASKSALEAEMCRRLWWSLAIYDSRISELAGSKIVTLDPTWDCNIPMNINDSDLRAEMKDAPSNQGNTSESIHAVVRSTVADAIRHSTFHLDRTRPILKSVRDGARRHVPEGDAFVQIERSIEEKYLQHCDPSNAVHLMTIWSTRAYLTKYRLLEYQSRHLNSSQAASDAQLDEATYLAIRMLECDTTVMTSPLTKGFLWLNHAAFPFPAYLQILQDIKRRPGGQQTQKAWDTMNANYEAWFSTEFKPDSPFFQIFAKLVLRAWEACEIVHARSADDVTFPQMVLSIKQSQQPSQTEGESQGPGTNTVIESGTFPIDPYTPMSLDDPSNFYGFTPPAMYTDMLGQDLWGSEMKDFDLNVLGGWPGWGTG